jgi:hypothetical protein
VNVCGVSAMVKGGTREGAGRKKESEPRLSKTLRFTRAEWNMITSKAAKRWFKNRRAQYLIKLVGEDEI